MKALRLTLAFSVAAAVACGERAPIGGELVAPEARQARISLSPALDISSLGNDALGDRIVIDEVDIGVSDIRLLGADPSIPAGGVKLIEDDRVLASVLGEDGALRLPFPEYLLDEDLSIYVRVDKSDDLGGASVVVRGRLFSQPISGQQLLTASSADDDKTGAPNPDGEPARGGAPNPDGEPARGGAPNPDGEPAHGGNGKAPNPDGEPARPSGEGGSTRHSLVSNGTQARSVAFELRGVDEADLVVGFDRHSRLEVVLAIPGARWLTPRVVERLERALVAHADTRPIGVTPAIERKTVVVDRGVEADPSMRDSMPAAGEGEAYRLLEGNGDPSTTRR